MPKSRRSYDSFANFTRPEIVFQVIPKMLYGITPKSATTRDWWLSKKFDASIKNNYCCWACGVHVNDSKIHRRLEGVAVYDIDYEKKKMVFNQVAMLCYLCNSYKNIELISKSYNEGFLDKNKYFAILAHGKKLIDVYDIKIYPSPNIDCFDGWEYEIECVLITPMIRSLDQWNHIYK